MCPWFQLVPLFVVESETVIVPQISLVLILLFESQIRFWEYWFSVIEIVLESVIVPQFAWFSDWFFGVQIFFFLFKNWVSGLSNLRDKKKKKKKKKSLETSLKNFCSNLVPYGLEAFWPKPHTSVPKIIIFRHFHQFSSVFVWFVWLDLLLEPPYHRFISFQRA